MTSPSGPSAVPTAAWKRYLPLAVLGLVMAIVLLNGWHRQLTLENVVAVRDRSQLFLQNHIIQSLLGFIAIYIAAVTLSLPGAGILTLTSGLLFGWFLGGLAAVTGASIGAIILFLIVSKTGFGDSLAAKAGPSVAKLQDGFRKDALSYLFFLRLVPAFPFFIVNIVAALIGMPLRTYVLGTVFGIMPASFAFASIGAGLDSVVVSAKAEHAACIAAKGAAQCKLSINAGNLVTKELLIAFALLGIVALIPVAYKKWSKSNVAVQ
jgi:uncharacterized membrane protein YdjX (TVP38/TMEM64 family)